MGYQYIGFGPIDLQPPFKNDPGETYVAPELPNQPYAVKWWKSGKSNQEDFDEPTQSRHTDREMYKMITDTTGGAISENPDSSMLVTHAMVFGPYSLNPGEKAKIVLPLQPVLAQTGIIKMKSSGHRIRMQNWN
jgi:hypothetical protein